MPPPRGLQKNPRIADRQARRPAGGYAPGRADQETTTLILDTQVASRDLIPTLNFLQDGPNHRPVLFFRRRSRYRYRIAPWVYPLGLFLCLFASAAHAELWGYVDERGTHFATEKLDERYQLFFKGSSSLDKRDIDQDAERRALEAFRRTPMYRR